MQHSTRLRIAFVWAGILLVTAVAVYLQQGRSEEGAAIASDEGGVVVERAEDPARAWVPRISMQSELVGKLTTGLRALAPTFPAEQILANAEPLQAGDPVDQLAYAVLVGSVDSWQSGADAAAKVEIDAESPEAAPLRELRDDVVAALELRAAQAAAPNAVSSELSDETLERMEERLGYFARVLGPDSAVGEANTTLVVILVVAVYYMTVFVAGCCVLLALALMTARGKWRARFEPASDAHAGIVLGEVFLLWIIAFLGFSVLAEIALMLTDGSENAVAHLICSMCAMLASLLTLALAPARGVSLRQLRTMIGLHRGEGFVKEAFLGIGCYLTAVPILALGLVVFFVLTLLNELVNGKSPPPSHPAVEMLGNSSGVQTLLLFMLASVVAPIVEEIAFRGLLFGHLRATVAPRIRFVSMLVAAAGSSFVFAVVHPQGVLFVPALGGLAVGFCIWREMRGSLIAPMVAHGINNAVTLGIGLTLLG